MRITLPYPPSANRYWRIVNNRSVRSREATSYIVEVDLLCREVGMEPVDGKVRVSVDVYRPRQAGDLDNHLKVALDALQRWAYHDDKQIVTIIANLYDDKLDPRVEVEVVEAGQ